MWFSAKWAIEVSQCWGLVHAGMWDVLTGYILTGLCIRSSMTSLTGRPRTSTLQLVMLPWAFSNALLKGNGGPLGHCRYSFEIMLQKQHKCVSSEFRPTIIFSEVEVIIICWTSIVVNRSNEKYNTPICSNSDREIHDSVSLTLQKGEKNREVDTIGQKRETSQICPQPLYYKHLCISFN